MGLWRNMISKVDSEKIDSKTKNIQQLHHRLHTLVIIIYHIWPIFYHTNAPLFSTLSLPHITPPAEIAPLSTHPNKYTQKNNPIEINHPNCFLVFLLTHSNLTIRFMCMVLLRLSCLILHPLLLIPSPSTQNLLRSHGSISLPPFSRLFGALFFVFHPARLPSPLSRRAPTPLPHAPERLILTLDWDGQLRLTPFRVP